MAHLRRSLEYALLILDHIPAMPLRLLDPPSCTPHEHSASISLQKKSNRRLWKDDAGYSLFPVQSAAELRQRSEASIICTLRRIPTAHSPPPPRTCARLSAAAVDFRHNVSRSFAFGASAARASHICSGTRPAAATSAPGLGPPLSHICSGTRPTALPHPSRRSASAARTVSASHRCWPKCCVVPAHTCSSRIEPMEPIVAAHTCEDRGALCRCHVTASTGKAHCAFLFAQCGALICVGARCA